MCHQGRCGVVSLPAKNLVVNDVTILGHQHLNPWVSLRIQPFHQDVVDTIAQRVAIDADGFRRRDAQAQSPGKRKPVSFAVSVTQIGGQFGRNSDCTKYSLRRQRLRKAVAEGRIQQHIRIILYGKVLPYFPLPKNDEDEVETATTKQPKEEDISIKYANTQLRIVRTNLDYSIDYLKSSLDIN